MNTIFPCEITCILAYIGPGAGFAFIGSILTLLGALVATFFAIMTRPLRHLLRRACKKNLQKGKGTRRAVVIGLDGLDPKRVRRLMEAGRLPAFKKLTEHGFFSELRTTSPPISPVAWSSFLTGVNPGKHNIFDFVALDRQRHEILPASARVTLRRRMSAWHRGGCEIESRRRSRPFWDILGEHGIFSTVQRVPMTFPPEPFNGLCLAGMGVPDLLGTTGIYTCYSSECDHDTETAHGLTIPIRLESGCCKTYMRGPEQSRTPLSIRAFSDGAGLELGISGQIISLPVGGHSDWIAIKFRVHGRTACGRCRFHCISAAPQVKLYVTAIHIDAEQPVMPISHPGYYATYLARRHGAFATLGMAEDTGALTDGIIDAETFLEQAHAIQNEREQLFFDALERTQHGLCATVFDMPDRIQHMFFRDNPYDGTSNSKVIDEVYGAMDRLVGRVLNTIDSRTLLLVMSDHGFTSFEKGVNLNIWLQQAGLLGTNAAGAKGRLLDGINWATTQAFAFGLSGIYLNLKDREAHGIVPLKNAQALMKRIIEGLSELKDPATGTTVVRSVEKAMDIYTGPYVENAPDLIVKYAHGYRVAWETANGCVNGELLPVNTRPWSGDHGVDPDLVPGVLMCNRTVDTSGHASHIMDLAPTILRFFGIEPPAYMDGVAWGVAEEGIEKSER